jgi:hypothetical protein
VGPGDSRNAVPGESRQIEIFNPLAVHVNIKVTSEPRGPFGDPSLGAMTFVDERGNNGKDGLGRIHPSQRVIRISSHHRCIIKRLQIRDQPTRPG